MNHKYSQSNGNSYGSSSSGHTVESKNLSPQQLKNPGNKYWEEVAAKGIAEFQNFIPRIDQFEKDAVHLVKYTKQRNYYTNKKKLEDMLEKLMKDMDRLAHDQQDKVPERVITAFMQKKANLFRMYQMPGPGVVPR